MKKQLFIIGIIFLLVCVGLSGCNEVGTTSINDIKQHSNRYINQTVKIIGIYQVYSIADTNDAVYIRITIPDNVIKPTPFVQNAEYKFTGIVRYGKLDYTGEELYLEVTKIETT